MKIFVGLIFVCLLVLVHVHLTEASVQTCFDYPDTNGCE